MKAFFAAFLCLTISINCQRLSYQSKRFLGYEEPRNTTKPSYDKNSYEYKRILQGTKVDPVIHQGTGAEKTNETIHQDVGVICNATGCYNQTTGLLVTASNSTIKNVTVAPGTGLAGGSIDPHS